jgi:dTMP kinase
MIIAIEGIDGAGKTTQVRLLCDVLTKFGVPAHPVKMALFVSSGYKYYRETLQQLKSRDKPLGLGLLSSLVALQTAHIINEEILPLHDKGEIVVCDRYLIGGLTYLRSLGAPAEAYLALADMAPRADLTVMLRIPLAVSIQRCQERSGLLTGDRLEHLKQIFDEFKDISERVDLAIDGTLPREEITEHIVANCGAVQSVYAGLNP